MPIYSHAQTSDRKLKRLDHETDSYEPPEGEGNKFPLNVRKTKLHGVKFQTTLMVFSTTRVWIELRH